MRRSVSPPIVRAWAVAWAVHTAFGLLAVSTLLRGTGARDATLLDPGAWGAMEYLRLQAPRITANLPATLALLALGLAASLLTRFGIFRKAIAAARPQGQLTRPLPALAAWVAAQLLGKGMRAMTVVLLVRVSRSLLHRMDGQLRWLPLIALLALVAGSLFLTWLLQGWLDGLAARRQVSSTNWWPSWWHGTWVGPRIEAAFFALAGGLLLASVTGQTAWGVEASGQWGRGWVALGGSVGLALDLAADVWWAVALGHQLETEGQALRRSKLR